VVKVLVIVQREGKVNGSQAKAYCNGVDDTLLEKVEVMMWFENFVWQFPET
jgi:hypothetical protein